MVAAATARPARPPLVEVVLPKLSLGDLLLVPPVDSTNWRLTLPAWRVEAASQHRLRGWTQPGGGLGVLLAAALMLLG